MDGSKSSTQSTTKCCCLTTERLEERQSNLSRLTLGNALEDWLTRAERARPGALRVLGLGLRLGIMSY
eukprot:scaffold16996_cov40-Prasinocladus_malaysianus.AAC.1